MSEEKKSNEVPRMDAEELKKFVLNVLDGSLFLSTAVKDQTLLPVIFMPLAMGALSGWTEEELSNIGVLYARMSQASPRAINGYPMFFEVSLMHKDDWERARVVIMQEYERLQNIEV